MIFFKLFIQTPNKFRKHIIKYHQKMGKQKESNKKYAKISEKVKSIIILEKKQFN